jgi:hypothetical protein
MTEVGCVPKIDLICLANSRKLGGHCVAGIKTDGTGWIRPVSNFADGELTTQQCRLPNGAQALPLDILRVEVAQQRPQAHQPENWLIAGTPWELVGHVDPVEAYTRLQPALVPGPDLLGNRLDRIAHATIAEGPVAASLVLIEPANIRWRVTTNNAGNRRTRCIFELAGAEYDLVVTDPLIEQRTGGLEIGVHPLVAARFAAGARVLLCVSLGEPLYGNWVHGDCFKLVAAVVDLPWATEMPDD